MADDLMTVPYELKNGKTASFNIGNNETFTFGFSFQDRVKTPRGLANVIGVREGDLYFHVDGDAGATYWSSCKCEGDFIARGFEKALEQHPPVDPNEYHKLKTVKIFTLAAGKPTEVSVVDAAAASCTEASSSTTSAGNYTAADTLDPQGDDIPPFDSTNQDAGAFSSSTGVAAAAPVSKAGTTQQECLLVMQNINGPCPIIALANALLVSGKLQLPEYAKKTFISSERLKKEILQFMCGLPSSTPTAPAPEDISEDISDAAAEKSAAAAAAAAAGSEPSGTDGGCPAFECPAELEGREVLSGMVQRTADTFRLAITTSEEEGLGMLSRFYEGLNVTPTFSHIDAFEGEEDVCLFYLAGLRVVHGWLISPEDEEFAPLRMKPYIEVAALGMDDTAPNSAAAAKFLDLNRSQLTQWGVQHLKDQLKEGEVTVFFHNNHFSTLVKMNGMLLVVVSDEGYTDRKFIVFEELSVSGDGGFYDGAGQPVPDWLLGIISQFGDHFTTDEIDQAVAILTVDGKAVTTAGVVEVLEEEKKKNGPPTASSATVTSTALVPHTDVPPPLALPQGTPTTTTSSGSGAADVGLGGISAAEVADEKFQQLVSMGFEPDRVRAALLTTNGSVERCIDMLFS